MKLLLLAFALICFVSQAQQLQKEDIFRVSLSGLGLLGPHKAGYERVEIATENALYSQMRVFGLQEIAKKAIASHRLHFLANPEHKIRTVYTASGFILRVTFEGEIWDVYGKDHGVSFVVAYQSWNSFMKLESYSLSK